jgi:hypothetical protein
MHISPATYTYLETALWSSTDDDGTPLDRDHAVDDLSAAVVERAHADLHTFYTGLPEDLQSRYALVDLAHDFWLTRNGHGAGFWDGDYPETDGTILTEHAKRFGEINLLVGDDGRISAFP